ncbi:MAG TPA: hypothetical protein VGN52_13195 [Burkholderiales bacterium]
MLTVNEYWDGPRLGIAEVSGVPHVYESGFDESADEYRDVYFVSPIDPALMALVMEDWEIWRRWDAARRNGEVTVETHPALPAERERCEKLRELIGDRLHTDPQNRKYFRARFRTSVPGDFWRGGEVEWTPATAPGPSSG